MMEVIQSGLRVCVCLLLGAMVLPFLPIAMLAAYAQDVRYGS